MNNNNLIEVSSLFSRTCTEAEKRWGITSQLICAMGEAGELTAAIGKYFQGRDPELVDVVEEAADTIIMAMQIREMVGHERFDEILTKKFNKFKNKIATGESKLV